MHVFCQDLLEDEDHTVRQVSVTGVSQVLVTYWDQIPTDVSADLLNILFAKLAWDQSSDDVRVAVIKVSVDLFSIVSCSLLIRKSKVPLASLLKCVIVRKTVFNAFKHYSGPIGDKECYVVRF